MTEDQKYVFTSEWHESIRADVSKAKRLQEQAAAIAKNKCHVMGDWMQINGSWVSWCQRCKRQAKATSRPFFEGEQELEGSAISELCTLHQLTNEEREQAWAIMRKRKASVWRQIHLGD